MSCYQCNSPQGSATRLCPKCTETRISQSKGTAFGRDLESLEKEHNEISRNRLNGFITVLCCWPLVMVAFGGMIGGGLGGLAGGLSVEVYKRTRSAPLGLLASIFFGFAALVVWYSIAAKVGSR